MSYVNFWFCTLSSSSASVLKELGRIDVEACSDDLPLIGAINCCRESGSRRAIDELRRVTRRDLAVLRRWLLCVSYRRRSPPSRAPSRRLPPPLARPRRRGRRLQRLRVRRELPRVGSRRRSLARADEVGGGGAELVDLRSRRGAVFLRGGRGKFASFTNRYRSGVGTWEVRLGIGRDGGKKPSGIRGGSRIAIL
jgi:hypothetical protein